MTSSDWALSKTETNGSTLDNLSQFLRLLYTAKCRRLTYD